VLVGPSFAQEVAEKQMTRVVGATDDKNLGIQLQKLCTNDYFSVDQSSDSIGVQICAALKNIIALAVGYLEGLAYGDNPKAFVITRGLQEMALLIKAMGAK